MGLRTGMAVAAMAIVVGAPAFALNANYVAGAWKNSTGGTCDKAFFKSGDAVQTKRGEPAVTTTVANAGTEVTGQLILDGARRGQLIAPATDKAMFLVDEQPGGKLRIMAIGEPVSAWPTVVLEHCPGSNP